MVGMLIKNKYFNTRNIISIITILLIMRLVGFLMNILPEIIVNINNFFKK